MKVLHLTADAGIYRGPSCGALDFSEELIFSREQAPPASWYQNRDVRPCVACFMYAGIPELLRRVALDRRRRDATAVRWGGRDYIVELSVRDAIGPTMTQTEAAIVAAWLRGNDLAAERGLVRYLVDVISAARSAVDRRSMISDLGRERLSAAIARAEDALYSRAGR